MRELNPSKDYANQYRAPMAGESLPEHFRHGIHLDGLAQTRIFHTLVGLRVTDDWSATPPVSERVLRGRLLIEEVFETLKAMGLTLKISTENMQFFTGDSVMDHLAIEHVEGSRYDPIETADGLADIKVIANGTAVSFGIPQTAVDCEVWASNMTKLDADGNPIVNRCAAQDCDQFDTDTCEDDSHLLDPTKPRGKVLKPESYVPANIARVYRMATAPYLDVEGE